MQNEHSLKEYYFVHPAASSLALPPIDGCPQQYRQINKQTCDMQNKLTIP